MPKPCLCLSDLLVARLPCGFENGFFLLEFMTVITTNGVLALLAVFISIKASGMPQAASMALSNRLPNREVRSLSAIKSVVPCLIST